MPLPPDIAPNTTCDIYNITSLPPNGTPRVTGEPIFLTGAYENIKPNPPGGGSPYTHMAIFGWNTDIRDTDYFYVPDGTGTGFNIVHLTRMGRNTPADRKVAYCIRLAVTYPTNEL
jgi:hypothetical protein